MGGLFVGTGKRRRKEKKEKKEVRADNNYMEKKMSYAQNSP